jgi:hypothetical protein
MNPVGFSSSDPVLFVGEMMEGTFRTVKDLPQFKYFTRPLYKSLVGKIGSVAATGITFIVTDMTMHQILPKIGGCVASYIYPSFITESIVGSYLGMGEGACDVGLNSTVSAICWMTAGATVMYAKYRRGY